MPGALVVDDIDALGAVTSALTDAGVAVSRSMSVVEALDSVADGSFDCVVATPESPGTDGVAVLRRVREIDPAVSTALVIGDGRPTILNRAHAAGIDHVLSSAAEAIAVAGRIQDIIASNQISRELDRHSRVEAAIRGATQTLMTGTDRRAIDRVICSTLVQSGFYSVAWISEFVGETNTLKPRTAAGIELADLTERPVTINLESVANVSVRATGENGPPTTVTVTLVHDDQLYGVLQLTTSRSISETERNLLTTLGRTAGAAMHRAAHTSGQPALELFSGVLSHELRNSLQTAHSHLDFARGNDRHTDYAGVKAALERIGLVADEAAAVARQDVPAEDRTVHDLGESASTAWDRIHAPDCLMTVVNPELVEANHALLEMILENLFRNSVEHGSKSIRVGMLPDGFYVEDTGPGIPSDVGDQVFEWAFTTREEGSGLGLAVVKRIVDAHGWTIHVADVDDGARFEITGV